MSILGQEDAVKTIIPLVQPSTQPAEALAARFLELAEQQARLVAEYAQVTNDLGPQHRQTLKLKEEMEQGRKNLAEARALLTRQQREQLLLTPQPTGPRALLRSMEQQLSQLQTQLGPNHRQVKDLSRRVEAVRRFVTELERELNPTTQAR